MAADDERDVIHTGLMLHQSRQPAMIHPPLSRFSIPGYATGQLGPNAEAHGIDVAGTNLAIPLPRESHVSAMSHRPVLGPNDPDVEPERRSVSGCEGVRLINVVVVPEADVLSSSLSDSKILRGNAEAALVVRKLEEPAWRRLDQCRCDRIGAIGNDEMLDS